MAGPTIGLPKRPYLDPRFNNKGNKLRPKYESPVDMLENLENDPLFREQTRKAPKQTRLRPPMQNLIYDPRVHRGNLFRRPRVEDDGPKPPPRVIKRLQLSCTPEPLVGRQHMDIQTDMFLEDRGKEMTYNDFDTQTDEFLDRPQTPFFIPWKSGPDAFTQIFPGDLFDFDMEVEPLCEVLAGRALEQGLMEVQEEKQLEHLRCHQDLFEQMRVAELTATQRMEAAERRLMEEKELRLKQEKARLKEEEILRLRTEAMGYAMRILKGVTDKVYDKLTRDGYFYDPVERELEEKYIPVLLRQMQNDVTDMVRSRHAVAIMADEATPALDTAERAVDSIDLIMSRLMNVLDSWISFEDNVMVELAAAEQASQRVMTGVAGEVELVQHTSTDVTAALLDMTEVTHVQNAEGARSLVEMLLEGLDPQ
ncbi:flagellar radial spoke protein 3 [Physcomitrium patens]|uniref:Uncharacterized protein n=1 Tax=Physcomitrium patens TaxID=3218 RepID=A9S297_PHYPA|nr:flagellar radial spoke protein 3-like [Physcomitrium patens]PNR50822.1 hypothetical protein PHYPA_010008 [Physcomitrium patens]|eukprot:XP_024380091.1 flagellar radial spoke protein 3-like [Physcomitrella patens]